MRRIPVLLTAAIITAVLTACSSAVDKTTQSVPAVSPTMASPGPTTLPTDVPASPESSASMPTPTEVSPSNKAEAKDALEKRIKETMSALKHKDIKQLAGLAHPDKGIQFSPYAYIDTTKDIKVKAEEMTSLWKDSTAKLWGQYDGSGAPIELNFAAYFERFVYDHDYANAPKIGYNKAIGSSTTKNNLFEVYPKDQYMTVEYHFEGFDQQFKGTDWASLRLVFMYDKEAWFLVAVVHDQWTT